MIQSNNTKSENLENDFTELLEETHLLGGNETTKSVRCWAEKEEVKVRGACLELLETSVPELSDLVVWSGGFEVRSADGKCGGSGGRMDLLGRKCSSHRSPLRRSLMFCGSGKAKKSWNRSVTRFGMI